MALTSLLVASGIGAVGVVPALAAGTPAPAAFHRSDDDHGHDGNHHRWFRDRGDVRYVWFEVCEGTGTPAGAGATTTTTTPDTTTPDTTTPDATTGAVATDALSAAVEGGTVDTLTGTDTTTATSTETGVPDPVTGTTTETAPAGEVDEDDPDAEAYPTFIAVPMAKDEAKAIRKLDDRPCYDLTTGAPQSATATPTTTETTTSTEVPTTTPSTDTSTPALAPATTG